MSRDFRLLVFSMDQFPPSIWVYHYSHFDFFRKFAEIFAAQGTQPVSTTPAANLPPVLLIPVAICHRRHWHQWQICRRYHWHRWQICHRCQQHKRNWWQNLPQVSLIPVANFPPVSLTPVVHLDLRISPRIFEKIRNDTNVIFRGLGEGDLWKKTWSKKSRDTVPLSWWLKSFI